MDADLRKLFSFLFDLINPFVARVVHLVWSTCHAISGQGISQLGFRTVEGYSHVALFGDGDGTVSLYADLRRFFCFLFDFTTDPSLTRKRNPPGPYRRSMPRVLGGS